METKLKVYNNGNLEKIQENANTMEHLSADLDRQISGGATNLFLFQHLGPVVNKVAIQYQQILTQISLVKDDISRLK
jgi:hypothetical protein